MLATADGPERLCQIAFQTPAVDECRRRSGHSRADPADEIPLDPLADGVRATIGPEALEVEAEALRAVPEVRIVDVPAVAVQRTIVSPERTTTAPLA